jgi:hypothetical protein
LEKGVAKQLVEGRHLTYLSALGGGPSPGPFPNPVGRPPGPSVVVKASEVVEATP